MAAVDRVSNGIFSSVSVRSDVPTSKPHQVQFLNKATPYFSSSFGRSHNVPERVVEIRNLPVDPFAFFREGFQFFSVFCVLSLEFRGDFLGVRL